MIKRAFSAVVLTLGCSNPVDEPPPPPLSPAISGAAINWRGKRWPAWVYIDAGMVPTITIRAGELSWEAAGCHASTVNRGEANCSGLMTGIDGEEIALVWMDVYGNIQIGSPTLQVEGRGQVKCWLEPVNDVCTPWTRDARDGEDG